jgi:hypothetical protein
MVYVYCNIHQVKLNSLTTFNQLNVCQFCATHSTLFPPLHSTPRSNKPKTAARWQMNKQNSRMRQMGRWKGGGSKTIGIWLLLPKHGTLHRFSWFLRRWTNNITCGICSIFRTIISQLARGSKIGRAHV